LAVGPTRRGKDTKILAVADVRSLPLAVSVQSASPHESQLVEEVLGHSFLDTLPQRLIGDKAYDSDALDSYLARDYGIEMIAPHRRDRARLRKMVAHLGAIGNAGGWNGSLPGCTTFAVWPPVGSITLKTSLEWSDSAA
jgi:hypothetical protein